MYGNEVSTMGQVDCWNDTQIYSYPGYQKHRNTQKVFSTQIQHVSLKTTIQTLFGGPEADSSPTAYDALMTYEI